MPAPDEDDDGYRESFDDEEPDDDSDQCQSCGAHIFTEEHDWDCPYAGDDEDDDDLC